MPSFAHTSIGHNKYLLFSIASPTGVLGDLRRSNDFDLVAADKSFLHARIMQCFVHLGRGVHGVSIARSGSRCNSHAGARGCEVSLGWICRRVSVA